MLLSLFDRIWTPTLVYLALTYTSYSLHHIIPSVLTYSVVVAATFYWGQLVINATVNEYKIDALGKRAPAVRTWTPWNLALLFRAIWYFMNYRNHEWWWDLYETHGNKNNPYTVEAITVGDRIIFTADEENVKAILATQFADFGKGPQFRKEWKDFLGLSEC